MIISINLPVIHMLIMNNNNDIHLDACISASCVIGDIKVGLCVDKVVINITSEIINPIGRT